VDIEEFIKKKNEKLKDSINENTGFFDGSNGQKLRRVPSSFNNVFPNKSDLNVDAVVIPENYREIYNINTYHKQHLIGNNEYLTKKEIKNYIGGNSSFQSVPVPPHINLYINFFLNFYYLKFI